MKKFLAIMLIALTVMFTPVKAEVPASPNWVWIGSWIWVGSGDPNEPKPPMPIK